MSREREIVVRVVPPGDVGPRYAAASGDHNPIHVDAAAARAVGLPGPILHGMWTLARAVTEVAPDPFALVALDVQLRGVGLPGVAIDVTVCAAQDGASTGFAAMQDGRELLRDGRAVLRP